MYSKSEQGPVKPQEESLALSPDELAGLTIHDAFDPELGLTNIAGVPAQDWAANTGATKNPQIDKEPDDVHPAPENQEESD